MRSDDPIRAKDVFEKSELLVQHARNGNFRKFCLLVDTSENDDIMPYFIPKMFKEALFANNLMIVSVFFILFYCLILYSRKGNVHY